MRYLVVDEEDKMAAAPGRRDKAAATELLLLFAVFGLGDDKAGKRPGRSFSTTDLERGFAAEVRSAMDYAMRQQAAGNRGGEESIGRW